MAAPTSAESIHAGLVVHMDDYTLAFDKVSVVIKGWEPTQDFQSGRFVAYEGIL